MKSFIKIFLNQFNISLFFSLIFILGIILASISFFYELDFGAFRRDYFEAHSLGMEHLHGDESFISLLKTIPNSASGVLPLYIYGLLDNFFQRQMLSMFFYLLIFLLIFKYSKVDIESKIVIALTIFCSPIMISSFVYCLPETIALSLLILFFFFYEKNPAIASILSFIIPFNRQTYVVNVFNQLFIRKNIYITVLYGALSFAGLLILYFTWDGLVPPLLKKVHMTPSIKAPINALLIFTLYFSYFYIKKYSYLKFSYRILFTSLFLTILNIFSPDLYGGGYIFSRIENLNLLLAIVLEFSLLYCFFSLVKFKYILMISIFCISFSTTNYMFLKYVDFCVISMITYFIFSDKMFNKELKLICMSIALFQIFSLSISILYYYVI